MNGGEFIRKAAETRATPEQAAAAVKALTDWIAANPTDPAVVAYEQAMAELKDAVWSIGWKGGAA